MTTFATMNPLGSSAPKDLYDNSENLDNFVNGPLPSYQDRFGDPRRSLAGIDQQAAQNEASRDQAFQEFLQRSGYVNVGVYAAGLVLTAANQVFEKDGNLYSIKNISDLPYTLTGVWASEQSKFVVRGDNALRADLAGSSGGVNVGFGSRNVDSKLKDVTSIADFPGAVEGAGNSAASAFVAAEASAAGQIFLPYGVWNAGGTVLNKHYYGLGKLITNGRYRGQEFSSITTDPQKASNPDFEFASSADISHINLARFDLGRIRNNLNEYYFNSATTPFWHDMVSSAGHSGTSAKFIATVPLGGDTLNLVGAAPEIVPGTAIRITNDVVSFNATCVSNSGTVLKFTPPSPYNFTDTFLSTVPPTYGYVTSAIRTMNTLHMGHVEHKGGGDSYIWCGRIINDNKYAQPAQNHFFETSTIGIIGGDLLNITPGGFMTGIEMNMSDKNYIGSYQSAAMGVLMNLQRTADTGQFGCTWYGFCTKSESTAYADVAYRAFGKFKRGLDFVGMQFDGDVAAITIPRNSRIYLDASANAVDTRGVNWWSDTPGGAWIGTGTGGDIIISHGGQYRIGVDTDHTFIQARTAAGHIILNKGYLDLYTDVAGSAGASAGYATVYINGVARKIQIFA